MPTVFPGRTTRKSSLAITSGRGAKNAPNTEPTQSKRASSKGSVLHVGRHPLDVVALLAAARARPARPWPGERSSPRRRHPRARTRARSCRRRRPRRAPPGPRTRRTRRREPSAAGWSTLESAGVVAEAPDLGLALLDCARSTARAYRRRAPGATGPAEQWCVRVTAKADYAVRALLELTVGRRGPGQGRADRPGPGHPAQVPREHPHRPAPRRDRARPARRGRRLLAGPTAAARSRSAR